MVDDTFGCHPRASGQCGKCGKCGGKGGAWYDQGGGLPDVWVTCDRCQGTGTEPTNDAVEGSNERG